MLRKWIIVFMSIAVMGTAVAGYHAYVIRRSKEHFQRLLEAPTVGEKRFHYDEIRRYFDPWNPYRERAERWLEEEGHEWEFLRETGRAPPSRAKPEAAAPKSGAGEAPGPVPAGGGARGGA